MSGLQRETFEFFFLSSIHIHICEDDDRDDKT